MSGVDKQFEMLTKGVSVETPSIVLAGSRLYLDRAIGEYFRDQIMQVSERMREKLPSNLSEEIVISWMARGLSRIVDARTLPISPDETIAVEGVGVYLWPERNHRYGGGALLPEETLVGRFGRLVYGNHRVLDQRTEEAIRNGTKMEVDSHPGLGPQVLLGDVEILQNRGEAPNQGAHSKVYVPLGVEALQFFRAA